MDRKTIWLGLGIFLALGISVLAVIYFAAPASFNGTTYSEPFPKAPEFFLTRADGSVFRMSDQQGRIVLLFFGFTSCTDVCPATLAELNQALGMLGDKANSIQVVFITVDPDRDTPEKTQEYVNQFNTGFIGLSGSLNDLGKIWSDYGVYREIVTGKSATDYDVEHTARVTLVDATGNMRVSYGADTPVEDIVHDLKLLIP